MTPNISNAGQMRLCGIIVSGAQESRNPNSNHPSTVKLVGLDLSPSPSPSQSNLPHNVTVSLKGGIMYTILGSSENGQDKNATKIKQKCQPHIS